MSDMTENEIRAKLLDYHRRIEAAATNDEKDAIAKESMEYYRDTGHKVPIESLEGAISFATNTTERILAGIIATAAQMESEYVPVSFLKELQAEIGAIIAETVWQSADFLGVPLDYGTPDDLSGLDNL